MNEKDFIKTGATAIRRAFKYAIASNNKNKLHVVKGIIN